MYRANSQESLGRNLLRLMEMVDTDNFLTSDSEFMVPKMIGPNEINGKSHPYKFDNFCVAFILSALVALLVCSLLVFMNSQRLSPLREVEEGWYVTLFGVVVFEGKGLLHHVDKNVSTIFED